MISLLLSVTTGREFRVARRRLFLALAYVAVIVIGLSLVLLVVSPERAILVLALAASLYLLGLLLPLYLGLSAARRLKKFSQSGERGAALGVFYLVGPTRDWLIRRKVGLFRFNQFAALLVADGKLQVFFLGGGRPPASTALRGGVASRDEGDVGEP